MVSFVCAPRIPWALFWWSVIFSPFLRASDSRKRRSKHPHIEWEEKRLFPRRIYYCENCAEYFRAVLRYWFRSDFILSYLTYCSFFFRVWAFMSLAGKWQRSWQTVNKNKTPRVAGYTLCSRLRHMEKPRFHFGNVLQCNCYQKYNLRQNVSLGTCSSIELIFYIWKNTVLKFDLTSKETSFLPSGAHQRRGKITLKDRRERKRKGKEGEEKERGRERGKGNWKWSFGSFRLRFKISLFAFTPLIHWKRSREVITRPVLLTTEIRFSSRRGHRHCNHTRSRVAAEVSVTGGLRLAIADERCQQLKCRWFTCMGTP